MADITLYLENYWKLPAEYIAWDNRYSKEIILDLSKNNDSYNLMDLYESMILLISKEVMTKSLSAAEMEMLFISRNPLNSQWVREMTRWAPLK